MRAYSMIAAATMAVAMVAMASPAQAATVAKFDQAAFTQAVKQGKPVLVDVKAWWCPVCASQNRTIKAAIADPKFNSLTIFELNYDSQPDAWKALGVHKQATLIGYRGGRETGRIAFQTDKAQINALLNDLVK